MQRPRLQRSPRILACALAMFATSAIGAERIVVASKIDTEGALLGSMIAITLQRSGYAVENRIQLGPTRIVREAILSGQIDIYPEYTGNGAFFFHAESDPAWKDATLGYEKVKALDRQKNSLAWLTPAPVSNTWSIVVTNDLARTAQLSTLEDFARYANAGNPLKLAASAEFVESPTALPAFQTAYGFALRDDQLLVLSGGDTAATNRIAAEHLSGVNAAMAYTTDGAIKTLGLVVLTDTRYAQTVFLPCPVIRQALLDRHPQIADALNRVFTSLSLQTLQALNARISVDGEDAAQVARSYLDGRSAAE